jgi:hypothetical protein
MRAVINFALCLGTHRGTRPAVARWSLVFLGGFPGLITASCALAQPGETLALAALAALAFKKCASATEARQLFLSRSALSLPLTQTRIFYYLCFFYCTTRDTPTVALLHLIYPRSLQITKHTPLHSIGSPLDTSLYKTLAHHVLRRRLRRRRSRW